MERRYDLLVLGELNVDLILTGIRALPAFGQVEQQVEDALFTLGGSSAIVACGAARLGLKVGFVGKMGDDILARFLLGVLELHGVNSEKILVDDSLKTGITVHLSRGTDRVMLTYSGSIAALHAAEIDPALLGQARHVHVSSYFLQTGLQGGIRDILSNAHRAGATTSLDPGYDPSGRWDDGLSAALDEVDIFLPNAQEALSISGTQSVAQALETLAQRVPTVVIKEGGNGARAQAGALQRRQAAFRLNAVDAVGAGDSFDAGFLYAQLHGMNLETSLTWGCACGALATTRIGGIEGQPDVPQVESLLMTGHILEST